MTKITKEYTNTRNGGTERVIRDGENYFINSNFGKGFCSQNVKVTRSQVEATLRFTSAPAEICAAILGE